MLSDKKIVLGKREAKKYDDPHGWHNLFYANVTSQIDETIFAPLFKEGNMGAPNDSIRVIIGMSIIKEGFGCSDEELFEKCQFDLLVRKDSKLIGSNIAGHSRFEIIHNTFRQFIKGPGESGLLLLNPKFRNRVVLFLEEGAQKMVYRLNSETIGEKISSLGRLIYQVLKRLSETIPGYDLLHRIFHEQYEVVKRQAILRPKEDIAAKSVQNHNDPDADYREGNPNTIWE